MAEPQTGERSYLNGNAWMRLWRWRGAGFGHRHAISQATTTDSRIESIRNPEAPGRRDLKKEIFMKRTIAAIALFAASIFITAGVWAQSVKATIPFDFTVNNTLVPAGTYTITSASSDHNVFRISDQKQVHLLSAALHNPGSGSKASVLVFHKY